MEALGISGSIYGQPLLGQNLRTTESCGRTAMTGKRGQKSKLGQ